MDFERDIKIEDSALDVECLQQPTLMLQYGSNVAYAEMELAKAKRQLEIAAAELDLDIRTNPDQYDLAKITESAIQNTIKLDEGYKADEAKVLEAQHTWKVAKAALESISQKKDMLEALIRLHGQQYFAGPKLPRDLHHEWIGKQKQEKGNQQVAAAIKRRSK